MPSTRYSGVWTLTQAQQAIINQNWTNIPPPNVECLVVAGGGSGGTNYGGGGGAGGLRAEFTGVIPGSAITVTVGAGGAASSNNGNNSVFGAITAQAGGAGGTPGNGGNDGGSGGGAGGGGTANYYQPGIGTVGQGNNGGANTAQASVGPAGGGGGAGTNGVTSVASVAGIGGDGIASSISGTLTMYAGGGGGGTISGDFGTGGLGGGGNGANNTNGSAGTANTGGGGGGGGGGSSAGGAGGSGIVIISYPDIYAPAVSTTGSPTVTTSGSGSVSFASASSQYVSFTDNAAYAMGTANFTIEGWFYTQSSGATQVIIGQGNATDSNVSFIVRITSGNKLEGAFGNGTALSLATGATSVTTNTWNHFAFVRDTNTCRIYLNGVQDGTVSVTGLSMKDSSQVMSVGRLGDQAANYFNGYLSNIRILNGTCLYPSGTTFTVPVAPLAVITNTAFLFSAVSGSPFVDTSSYGVGATLGGTPSWNASSPFVTGAGFKNRVYQWTSSGSVTF